MSTTKVLSATARKCLVDNAGKLTIPALSAATHTAAHSAFTETVVAMTLRDLGFPKRKAERLALIHQGCPRVRLERIIRTERCC